MCVYIHGTSLILLRAYHIVCTYGTHTHLYMESMQCPATCWESNIEWQTHWTCHTHDMCNARGSMSTSIMLLLGQVPLQLPPKTAKRAD